MTAGGSTALARRIRRTALELIRDGGSGHPGGSLSIADLLAVLFTERERAPRKVLLSKGHGAPALYAAMLATGALPDSTLPLRALGSTLQGHPDRRFCAELEISSGSLGQGASLAVGLAHSLRMRSARERVVVILGDGELQEGQVWEAAMCAAHLALGNLVFVVDANGLQHDGPVDAVMPLGGPEGIAARFRAFGWSAANVDGHDHGALRAELLAEQTRPGPHCVVATTVKGKGVPFMEGVPRWHSLASPRELSDFLDHEAEQDRRAGEAADA